MASQRFQYTRIYLLKQLKDKEEEIEAVNKELQNLEAANVLTRSQRKKECEQKRRYWKRVSEREDELNVLRDGRLI